MIGGICVSIEAYTGIALAGFEPAWTQHINYQMIIRIGNLDLEADSIGYTEIEIYCIRSSDPGRIIIMYYGCGISSICFSSCVCGDYSEVISSISVCKEADGRIRWVILTWGINRNVQSIIRVVEGDIETDSSGVAYIVFHCIRSSDLRGIVEMYYSNGVGGIS